MFTIRLLTDIVEDTLAKLTKELDAVEDGSDITLQICSAGGLIYDAIGIIDFFNARKLHVTAEVLGYAASAAALLALSCEKVRMGEYGSLLLHSAYNREGVKDEGVERANTIQLSIIKKRCPDFDATLLDKDSWFSASQAISMGLADELITNADSIVAICNTYLAKFNKEIVAMEEIKKDVKVDEEIINECGDDVKAEEISQEDVNEAILKRLEEIEHRLAVLEGEGKKADDEMAEDDSKKDDEEAIYARRKALIAKLTKVAAPAPAPVKVKAEKKSKIDLKNFFK